MARKRRRLATKKNTNKGGESTEAQELQKAPHSFVITRGNVSGHVKELTKDFRKVMEPFTASCLKARKRNTLKDFVSVAGLLHVSHIISFTQTELGVYLRIGKLPRGPTVTLRVHNYCLSRDVLCSLKKPVTTSSLFANSPLIVLNSFNGEGMHLKLMATTFQNMFPSINPTKVKLSSIKRCVLLNYDPETKLIDFRHYAIKSNPVGLSKSVKKITKTQVPDLSSFTDISEFVTKSEMLSDSEGEEDVNNIVTKNNTGAKAAIKLTELGPRLTLQLVKIEDNLMSGEILFHEFVYKSEEEKKAILKQRKQKMQLKEMRRKRQEENKKIKEGLKEQEQVKSEAENENN